LVPQNSSNLNRNYLATIFLKTNEDEEPFLWCGNFWDGARAWWWWRKIIQNGTGKHGNDSLEWIAEFP
jgi:hypothetical protein